MLRIRQLLALVLITLPALAQDPPQNDPLTAEVPETEPAEAPSGETTQVLPLKQELVALEADPLFAKTLAGVHVVDVNTGEEIWSRGGEESLIPASVMKTLTTAAALKTLGPTYRFPTWVMTDGSIDETETLQGNLYIKGQGDPTMVVERMWKMIHDIRMAGISSIKGDVIFDDGYFADSTLIPGWSKEEDIQEGPTYFAPLGALSLNYNIATMIFRPGVGVGAPAVVLLDTPTPAVVLENKLVTGRAGSRFKLDVERKVDEETGKIVTYSLSGSMPLGNETEHLYKTIADPLGNYIGGFQALAQEQGLKVKGRFRGGSTPKASTLLLKEESDTLAFILSEMNKHSNNFMAEQVLRSAGAETYGLPGTTEKGVRTINAYLSSLGIPENDFRLINGSGLSRDVRLRPSTITRMLRAMWNDVDVGPEFLTSLSVGGRDGTLWSRFREEGMRGRMRGKTGTLTGVSCLAGYVRSSDGKTYAFAFLVNDLEGANSRVRSMHDRLVRTLAQPSGGVADGG